jgi:uncharacterized protein (TIGR00251 family)
MLIKVKVFSNSKKQGIIKKSENSFEVRVKEKPLKGQANKEVIKVLADYFEVLESKVRLIKGFRHTNKIFAIYEEKN